MTDLPLSAFGVSTGAGAPTIIGCGPEPRLGQGSAAVACEASSQITRLSMIGPTIVVPPTSFHTPASLTKMWAGRFHVPAWLTQVVAGFHTPATLTKTWLVVGAVLTLADCVVASVACAP